MNLFPCRHATLILLAFLSVTGSGSTQRIPVSNIAAHPGTPIGSNGATGVDQRAALRTLSPAAQAQVSSVIGKDLSTYHFVAGPDGLRMTNAGRGVTAEFTPGGVSFRNGADEWGMDLRAYGHGDRLRNAPRTSPGGAANRIEYRRGAVTEWYVNGPKGLEQGFTLERRPAAPKNGKPLTLAFAMSGNLAASVDPGKRSLTLRKDKSSSLQYGGLTALDANGHELPAWLEVSGTELRIRVDDAGARYPLTIDPYVQATTLTTVMPCDPAGVCDDGAWFDHFGYTVSISADASTVVVGVPYKYTNSIARGAAYVFLKPDDFAGGWNSGVRFKTKLLASDGATNGLHLAYSVDISGDGSIIVAGAPALSFSGAAPPSGAAYVFLKPAGGWGSFQVQTENARLAPAPQNGVDNRGSFGTSVAISGNGGAIAAGAPEMRAGGVHYGATYVFLKPGAGWVNTSETQKIQGAAGSYHGSSVALSNDASTLVAGATGENPAGGAPDNTGAAYVFVRNNPGLAASYLASARLTPSDGIPSDIFGWTIAMNGNGTTVVVGAPGDSSDTQPHGAAYVFVRPPAGWGGPGSSLTETARLATSDGNGNDSLGASVDISLDGNTIAASTFKGQNNPSAPQNGVYFFAKPAAGWSNATEDTKIMSPGAVGDWFGWSTSLSGTGGVAVAGAPGTEINANLFQGAVYVFTGAAPTPRASVSPASLTFASQPIGTTSTPQIVTVTNPGSAPLQITNVGVTGHFTTTQNCKSASPIAPGSSCSETVAFKPFSVGGLTGTLMFTDNSGGTAGAMQTVQLQGNGATGNTTTTIVSVSPNPVFVNTSTLVAASVSAGNFSVSGPVTIEASTGETCTSGGDSNGCFLTFSTLGPRTVTATYHGNNSLNGSTSPGVLVLAIDFSISASPTSHSVSGRKATYKVTVTGQGQFAGPVVMGCVGGPPGTTCAVSPASVSLSGPTADAKATVTVPAGAAPGTYTMTFSGTFGGVTRLAGAKLIVK